MSAQSWTSDRTICPWQPTDGVPVLEPGTVHLWWVSLTACREQIDKLRCVLSAREQARAARYRFERHSDAFIVARSTLRFLLHGYTGVLPEDIDFVYGPRGKPALVSDSELGNLDFNYSDAAGRALYAFARDAELGVDIEDLNRDVSFERIVRRKFTAEEIRSSVALSQSDRRPAFLACWTRKEGYGKAKGWGIYYPLDSVEVCVDCTADRFELAAEGSGGEKWIIRQLYPNRHFVGSLVYPAGLERGSSLDIRYLSIEPGRWVSP